MQKLFLPLLFVFLLITKVEAQQKSFEFATSPRPQRLFDQAVQLKTCNITIDANPFIATTVVEMEFYNDKDQEVEALHTFQLNRGQVITDFKLELNGRYREGSIEERWKVRQSYNSIVGKRVDPAILQMDLQDHYRLNIYPVAAKSSRKVKFTITQMMEVENLKLSYTLPLSISSTTAQFNLDINVSQPASIPYGNKGLLDGTFFNMQNDKAILRQHKRDIILGQPISFSISQFTNKPQFCIHNSDGKTNFLMRFFPDMPRYYSVKPKTINVYWDVSLSGRSRNLFKELDFLENYIETNAISKTTIFLFNHQMQGIIVFNRGTDNFRSIRNYLIAYNYAGATELGILDFTNVLADAVLLFSDGINSVGKGQPKLGAVQVNFITSNYRYYNNRYQDMVGNTGGAVINLTYVEGKDMVRRIDSAENFLFKYGSANIKINESFPLKLGNSVLLSGRMKQADNLELFYGNNTTTNRSENYFLPAVSNCDESTFKKMQMLKTYDSLVYNNNYYYNWQQMIVFGLTEKVVTPQTSFLVLERIEDYIKYKIAPPKELEKQCAELNYVYRSDYKIKALKEFTEQEILDAVVNDYNRRIKWWNKDAALIDLTRTLPSQNIIDMVVIPAIDKKETVSPASTPVYQADINLRSSGTTELKEVVVTSAFGIKRTGRSTASYVQNLTGDQVNTIRQANINNALAGKVAGAQVRSQSFAKLGAETSIRLRGENGLGIGGGALYVVDGTIMPSGADINPDDVEDYSVLQGPAAAALFGPDGSNGAIVMTLKKAKRGYPRQYYVWSEYKLNSAPDEDYVEKMKAADSYELWDVFRKLEKENPMDVGFYFEMANFFFEKGRRNNAQELMYNAIELCNGSSAGLKLAAYLYEKWGWFDKAIAVYKGILYSDENNLAVKRDLALAYYQNKNFGDAVKTYYAVITSTVEGGNSIKENALAEMNAILLLHKNEFDVSWLNLNMVKILPIDLRVSVETNYGQASRVQFIAPRNAKADSLNKIWCTIDDYAVKDAVRGNYRVKVDANNNYSYPSKIPMYVRVVTFKNFHKENMQMDVKIYDLDNQYGVIELDEINW